MGDLTSTRPDGEGQEESYRELAASAALDVVLDLTRMNVRDAAHWARGVHRYFDAVELFAVPATESFNDLAGLELALAAAREAKVSVDGLADATSRIVDLLEEGVGRISGGPAAASPSRGR